MQSQVTSCQIGEPLPQSLNGNCADERGFLGMFRSALLGLSVATVASLSISATPAQAAWSACSSGYVCAWGHDTYNGDPWFEQSRADNYNTGWSNNDETSSVANRSGSNSAYLYDDTDTSATHGVVCVSRNYSVRDLAETTPSFNDRVSSIRIASGACATGISRVGSERTS